MNQNIIQNMLLQHSDVTFSLLGISLAGLVMLAWDTHSSRSDFFYQKLRSAMDIPQSASSQWLSETASVLPTLLLGQSGKRKMSELLVSAGFRSRKSLVLLALAKWLLGLCGAASILWYIGKGFTLQTMAFSTFGFVFGSSLPERWLTSRAKKIQREIVSSIPDALDLLVACVEAGLTLDKAIERVGNEIRTVAPALSEELTITHAELLVTGDRKKALTNLATRVKIQELENMAYTLAQSDRYGTPIGKPLRGIASESRTNRLLELEEHIGKLPAKMSLPLVGFVLFPLVILMVAPPIIMTLRILGGK